MISSPGGIAPAIYNKTSDSNLEERFIFTRIRVYFRYSLTITSIKRCVSAIVFLAMLFKSVLSNNRNLRLCFSFSYKNKFPQRFITVSRAFYEPSVRRANKRPAHAHRDWRRAQRMNKVKRQVFVFSLTIPKYLIGFDAVPGTVTISISKLSD